MHIIQKTLLAFTLALPLIGCGHAIVPLQHHGNEALAVVYYDAEAQAFDICSRLENTRNFHIPPHFVVQP